MGARHLRGKVANRTKDASIGDMVGKTIWILTPGNLYYPYSAIEDVLTPTGEVASGMGEIAKNITNLRKGALNLKNATSSPARRGGPHTTMNLASWRP